MRNKLAQQRATALRKQSTDAERKLWFFLRKRYCGVRFRRQVPIGPFIADFACLSARLIVELDGSQHSQGADAARDAYLRARGFRVLRFWDNEALTQTSAVLEVIWRQLENSPPP